MDVADGLAEDGLTEAEQALRDIITNISQPVDGHQ